MEIGDRRCLEPRPCVCEMLVKVDKVRANNNRREAVTVTRVIKYLKSMIWSMESELNY